VADTTQIQQSERTHWYFAGLQGGLLNIQWPHSRTLVPVERQTIYDVGFSVGRLHIPRCRKRGRK
jgi:hypothetical protein